MPLTRRELLLSAAAAAAAATAPVSTAWARAAGTLLQPGRPRPTPSQLLWQRDELALFLHFGVNTFTDREWGDGTERPAIFAPTAFDAGQWARVARETGFKALVLTAKHHDGFCLWPTATTSHSVASSSWMDGKGDVVRAMVDACRQNDLRVGLYCSPWDRNHPTYGDSDRYNDVFMQQLTELLTNYGPIHEVWFDGANGEGPNGKRQVYDWPRTWAHVRKLQPDAVIFSDAGPDVRWIGNERGVAGETHWSMIRSTAVPHPGAPGDEIIAALQNGHPDGDVWRPGETDVSIRPGWFYHPAEDARVKSVSDLVDIYFSSVGRNSKLLLNVPPTREGLLHEIDVQRLRGMKSTLDAMFDSRRIVAPTTTDWRATGNRSAELIMALPTNSRIALIDLREEIERGQRVARWTYEVASGNTWTEVAAGTTIGYRALRRIVAVTGDRARLRIHETVEAPIRVQATMYGS